METAVRNGARSEGNGGMVWKSGEEGGVRRWEVPKIGIWDDIGNVEFDGDEVR